MNFAEVSGVYRIYNEVTEECYIGSSKNVRTRMSAHLSMLRKGVHYSDGLQAAWDKYGPESFSFSVLEELGEASDRDDLYDREVYWIREFDSVESGYNKVYDSRNYSPGKDDGFVTVSWNLFRPFIRQCGAVGKICDLLVTEGSTGKPVMLTIKEISARLRLGWTATAREMAMLSARDIIRRDKRGLIYVNPSFAFKGPRHLRLAALSYYRTLEKRDAYKAKRSTQGGSDELQDG